MQQKYKLETIRYQVGGNEYEERQGDWWTNRFGGLAGIFGFLLVVGIILQAVLASNASFYGDWILVTGIVFGVSCAGCLGCCYRSSVNEVVYKYRKINVKVPDDDPDGYIIEGNTIKF